MTTAATIARLTADLASTTCPVGARRIRRELVQMGAARERLARIKFREKGGPVREGTFAIFDNPYDLDQYRLTARANAVLAGAGYSNVRVIRWSFID